MLSRCNYIFKTGWQTLDGKGVLWISSLDLVSSGGNGNDYGSQPFH